jgi:hypothetical protein
MDSNSGAQTDQPSVLQVQRARPLLIDRTLEVFQRRASKALTCEDARQIAENITGFFEILMEWEAAEHISVGLEPRTENSKHGSASRLSE